MQFVRLSYKRRNKILLMFLGHLNSEEYLTATILVFRQSCIVHFYYKLLYSHTTSTSILQNNKLATPWLIKLWFTWWTRKPANDWVIKTSTEPKQHGKRLGFLPWIPLLDVLHKPCNVQPLVSIIAFAFTSIYLSLRGSYSYLWSLDALDHD
jgi:hypothetical protein